MTPKASNEFEKPQVLRVVKMKVKSIEFGFFSPKVIKDMAAVKIEHTELYDQIGRAHV